MAGPMRLDGSKKALYSAHRRFFFRHFLTLLTAFLIPVVLLGFAALQITQNHLRGELHKNSLNVLYRIHDNVEMVIDDVVSISLTFSSNPEMIGMLKQAVDVGQQSSNVIFYNVILRNLLVSSAAARPYIQSIYIYVENEDGNFISSTGGLESVRRFHDSDWLESYRTRDRGGHRVWNETRMIRRSEFDRRPIPVITFYQQFFNQDGLAVLNVHRDYLQARITGLNLMEGQRVAVFNDRNELVLSSGDLDTIPESVLAGIAVREETSFAEEIDGTRYHVSKLATDTYGWNYVSITPTASLYTVARQVERAVLVILIGVIGLCFALAAAVTRRTSRHVSSVIGIIDAAEAGQPIPPVPDVVRDEFEYIIRTILRTYIEQSALKRQLAEERLQLRILELVALQARISPHFLFNTLKAVFWMSYQLTGSKNDVSRMVENLSSILSYSLGGSRRVVRFEEEIQNSRDYIEIERLRYRDRIEVVWDCPDSIGDYVTVPLLIQPLVENAISHGIVAKGGRGTIAIRIEERKDCLVLSVTDDGAGLAPERLREINEELKHGRHMEEHIGIYNCSRRLALTFGRRYGIRLESEPGRGTAVFARLPKRRLEELDRQAGSEPGAVSTNLEI